MRKYVLILLLILSSRFILYSQFKRGDFELAIAGNIGSSTLSIKYRGESELIDIYNYRIFLSPGYYLMDGLSISTDLGVNIEKFVVYDELSVEKFGILNLSYTYRFPDSKISVFLKAGYGFSDAPKFSATTYLIEDNSNSLKANVLNLSSGIKILLSNYISVIAEINYRSKKWKTEYVEDPTLYLIPQNIEINFVNKKTYLLLGVAYLF